MTQIRNALMTLDDDIESPATFQLIRSSACRHTSIYGRSQTTGLAAVRTTSINHL